MSASQRDISHRVARVCVRVQEGEKERLRRITSKISPAFYAQMSSLSLPLSPPLMWPVLISGADIAAVPSPLVEKDSFPTEKDALEHSTRTQHTHAHSHTQTHSSTFEQWEEAALTENGFFWGGEWKDQVAVKSTKPRATLRAARCQQLLFCLSMCCARTRTHKHTATGTQTHNCLWQEQAALWPLAGSWLRQTLTLQITDFHTFSLVFSPKNSWIIPKLNFLLEETMNGFYKTQKNKHISNPACVFMIFFLRIFWNWPEDDKCCSTRPLCIYNASKKTDLQLRGVVSRVSAASMLISLINTQVASQNSASSNYRWWLKCVIMRVCGKSRRPRHLVRFS